MIQLGAEWIHGRGNPIFKISQSIGALAVENESNKNEDENEKIFYYTNFGEELDTQTLEIFYEFFKNASLQIEHFVDNNNFSSAEGINLSVGLLYEKVFEKFLQENLSSKLFDLWKFKGLFEYSRKIVESEYGCSDWNKLSFKTYSDYHEPPTQEDIEMNNFGYKLVLDTFLSKIPKNKIKLNCWVVYINWSLERRGSIEIRTENGDIIKADHVIITCPLGHLKLYSNSMFEPKLNEKKQTAIDTIGIHLIISKVLL